MLAVALCVRAIMRRRFKSLASLNETYQILRRIIIQPAMYVQHERQRKQEYGKNGCVRIAVL